MKHWLKLSNIIHTYLTAKQLGSNRRDEAKCILLTKLSLAFDPFILCCFSDIPLTLKGGKYRNAITLNKTKQEIYGESINIKFSQSKNNIFVSHVSHMRVYWNSFLIIFAQFCEKRENFST